MEVELSNVQSWIEATDPDLNGQNGDPGLIRLFHDDRAVRAQREADHMRSQDNRMLICAAFAAVPVLIEIAKLLHWLK